MTSIAFEKWHGAGNDFVVIDAGAFEVTDPRALAVRECDRDHGVGADGLLLLELDDDADPVRVHMRLYQPDGSTAAMCGNGARCAARWAADRTGAAEVVVATPAGDRRAVIHDGGEVTVGMGTPSFEPADVPLAVDRRVIDEPIGGLEVTAVTTGVPHAVAFVDDVDDVSLEALAPGIRHHEVFAEGANVTVADDDGEGGFRQRTFERGVEGETVACGTGAVAIVAVARLKGLVSDDEPVTVSPPGGRLVVRIDTDGSATLRGPVVRETAGELAPPVG